jgi:hypothetical protein
MPSVYGLSMAQRSFGALTFALCRAVGGAQRRNVGVGHQRGVRARY